MTQLDLSETLELNHIDFSYNQVRSWTQTVQCSKEVLMDYTFLPR